MLTVASASCMVQELDDVAADLRARLREATGQSFRRINRFVELALLGAQACRKGAGSIGSDAALYLSCDTSALADSAKIVMGWIEHRRPPAPFDFINVSSNMAGFYVAQLLGLDSPQLALHRNHASFEAALELALLDSGRHRRALLGYVEEGVWPLAEQRERLGWDGPIAECSHWIYLDADCARPLGWVERVERHAGIEDALAALQALQLSDCTLSLGRGWTAQEQAAVAAALSLPLQAPLLPETVWSGGRTAQGLCAFLQKPATRRWLHLNRVASGACHALLARCGSR